MSSFKFEKKKYYQMIVRDESGLNFKLNPDNLTASVVKSPDASGSVFIPRFIQNQGRKYKIITLENRAFYENKNKIESVIFPSDSEVEAFKDKVFSGASLRKLQIPAKLKNIGNGCFFQVKDLTDIEVSPKNKHFIYFENQFLLGKSDENNDKFDILIYSRFDLTEATIPPCVRVLREHSLCMKMKSLIFSQNAELERIEFGSLSNYLTKLQIPKSIKLIEQNCFAYTLSLVEIKVSPENQAYKCIDNKYLLTKSGGIKTQEFDVLAFCRRDARDARIPRFIKRIGEHAFSNCNQLLSITFEPNSSLEIICSDAFSWIPGPESITIPPSVKTIERAFTAVRNLKYIQILGDDVQINHGCFQLCDNLQTISFPNTRKLFFDDSTIEASTIEINKGTESSGRILEHFRNRINFIDGETKPPKESTFKKEKHDEKTKKAENKRKDESINGSTGDVFISRANFDKLVNYVRKLEDDLSEFKDIRRFDFNDFKVEGESEHELKEKEARTSDQKGETNFLIGAEESSHMKVEKRLGEGSRSIGYKVIDDRTSRVMCKKVIKVRGVVNNFKNVQNTLKEFQVLLSIDHPCICKSIFMNLQENINTSDADPEDNDDHDESESGNKSKRDETTVSIYIEYLEMNLKDIIDGGMLTNTLKVKITLEVAFGMRYLHKHGMIHRDLKVENIMLNGRFEAKIVGFDLVHVSDIESEVDWESSCSLTKGIGTLAYMSPEMQNEEDYDEKTDIYSFGIFVYYIFTGQLPKQKMKDKLNKVPMRLPEQSSSISEFCIDLIKKCVSIESTKRPSFDEIIKTMKDNSFSLAGEVDEEFILQRYRSLNHYEQLRQQQKQQKQISRLKPKHKRK